jgi:hypothetical protein
LINEQFEHYDWNGIWNGEADSDNSSTGHTHSDGMDGPAVNIWYPVFTDLVLSENRKEVAILSMTTRWDSFFFQMYRRIQRPHCCCEQFM